MSSMGFETAVRRAEIIATIREFFNKRDVIEVETPVLTHGSPTDCHIDPFSAEYHPAGARNGTPGETVYLHTSPEFAMKRLLAEGYGDLYQICKVFRNGERGRLHNPEFTMLEWYRKNFSMQDMINETAELLKRVLGEKTVAIKTYRDVFLEFVGIDPLAASIAEINAWCSRTSVHPPDFPTLTDGLQFLMAEHCEPRFPRDAVTFVTRFPAAQAVFAAIDKNEPAVSLRFEAYCGRMELVNGFEECVDGAEYEARMAAENRKRKKAGKPGLPLDIQFIAAMESGLPACSGAALGVDRLVMAALGKNSIDEVTAFPWERS